MTFDVNEAAFKAEMPPVAEVLNTAVVDQTPLPSMRNVRLDTVLRKVLDRVPTASGATYIVRDRVIEITTGRALRQEVLGNSDRPMPPLVSARFDGRPLSDALRTVAERANFTILLDPRATDQAKTSLTARLTSVPVDTAVRLLADMAGLQSVQLDNALYVTTPDNARALEEEQRKRNAPAPSELKQILRELTDLRRQMRRKPPEEN